MNEIDELRKRIQELEESACTLLRVRGKDMKIAASKKIGKYRHTYQPGEGTIYLPAVPLIEYTDFLKRSGTSDIRHLSTS